MKHQIDPYNNRCRRCNVNRERIDDNLVPQLCVINKAARQRRQAHRQRKALGRALHYVRKNRAGYWRARRRGELNMRTLGMRPATWAWPVAVPRIVRKHAALLRRTLFIFGS